VQSEDNFEAQLNTISLDASCSVKWTSKQVSDSNGVSSKHMSGPLTCDNGTYTVDLTYQQQAGEYQLFKYSIVPQ
jgi:hypothetical protein